MPRLGLLAFCQRSFQGTGESVLWSYPASSEASGISATESLRTDSMWYFALLKLVGSHWYGGSNISWKYFSTLFPALDYQQFHI